MCVTGDTNGNAYPCPLMQEGIDSATAAFAGVVCDANFGPQGTATDFSGIPAVGPVVPGFPRSPDSENSVEICLSAFE